MIKDIIEEFKSARKWRALICPHGRYYDKDFCSLCPYPDYKRNSRFTIKDCIRLINRGLK